MAEAEAQTHAEKWITVAEAAHELKKSERTIRRQCEAGKLRGRLDKTDSGKTWMVCLAPVEDVTESVTEGQTQATSSTRSEDAAAKAADILGTAAIVPTHEMTAVIAPVAAPVITADNSEILAEVSEVKEQVEQIKSFLAGQMSVQMSEQMDKRLSALPTRDDFREDVAALMGSALMPVMQRLETLASENAQLQNELHNEKQKTLAQVRRPWWKKLFT